MAIGRITYEDKIDSSVNQQDPKYKITAQDMNEIKQVFNESAEDIEFATENLGDYKVENGIIYFKKADGSYNQQGVSLAGQSTILDGDGNVILSGYITPNDNLLTNSDFRSGIINQKGQTSYTSISLSPLYTIDRWKLSGNGKVIVNNGYIRIESTSSGTLYFTQDLDDVINENCISYANIKAFSGDIGFAIIGKGGKNKTVKISKTGDILNQHNECKSITFSITGNSSYVEIYTVKLEKGSYFTGMPVWNKAVELMKCYQNQYVLGGAWVNQFGARSDNNYVVITIQTPVELRKTPTIKDLGSSGQVQFTRLDSSMLQSANLSAISGVSVDGNFVQLQIPIGSYTQFGLGQAIFTTKVCLDSYDY